jgi:signal transduction histidine kinase
LNCFSDCTAVNQYEGTGIGLAICKKIMQNHRGFIEAEGAPGVGAVFTLYLPATPMKPKTILLIDDDEDDQLNF